MNIENGPKDPFVKICGTQSEVEREANLHKYHGQVLNFPQSTDVAEITKFISSLPKREYFLSPEQKIAVSETIIAGQSILFLPNDLIEQHMHEAWAGPHGRMVYKILLFGILVDGSKAAVILDGIRPFFDVKIPDDADDINNPKIAEKFISTVSSIVDDRDKRIYVVDREIVSRMPAKYFQENPSKYLRLYFHTTHARKRGIDYFLKNDVTYTNHHHQPIRGKLTTASDDFSCYYRKVSREYKIKLCDWNQLTNYTVVNDNDLVRNICVSHVFRVDVNDFRSDVIDYVADPIKYRDYLRDRSLEMAWDLETNTDENTGNAPEPDKVFDADGNPADTIFMDACTFSWYQEVDPFLVVNFTDLPVPSRPDCLIVSCKDQIDIIRVKALLVERMAPEFMVAFNDGLYDFPFILRRAEQYDSQKKTKIIEFMKKHMSCIPFTPENSKWTIRGTRKEDIKLEAGGINTPYEFFDVPGFQCIDVRTIFRQLYPSAEKSSLNFFLAINKLGSKEDMPYQTMFKIYRLMRILCFHFATKEYHDIIVRVQELIAKYGPEHNLFQLIRSSISQDSSKFLDFVDKSPFHLSAINLQETIDLIEKATEVVHYCNIDARRCHDLLRVRCVIADRRELANLSYTSFFDALFRAGGMKVRNLVMSEGVKPEWGINFSCVMTMGDKDPRKYPGAYVVPPKKGLYRDDALIKCRRRSSFQQANVDPFNQKIVLKSLADFDIQYPCDDTSNDQNVKHDRPCSGLDFSSLYPSLIMTYNFSPEKCIISEDYKNYLLTKTDQFGKPYRIIEVVFLYGEKDANEEEKELVRGWFVQHHPVEDATGQQTYQGIGVYAVVLKRMFDLRTTIKKKMDYYTGPKEFLEKVFEKYPIRVLKTIPDQHARIIRECLTAEHANRAEVYQNNPNAFYKYKLKNFEDTMKFFEHEFLDLSSFKRTCTSQTLHELYEEVLFFFNYYNSKQLGLKILMNTIYGESGNSLSPFFVKEVAGGITTYGRKNLKMVKLWVESQGYDVKYGDSVATEDTPILIRTPDKRIMYRAISELSDGNWKFTYSKDIHGNTLCKRESQPFTDLEVWSDAGWTRITNIIRHFTNKKIYRILTHTGCVDVTEDHSLLTPSGKEVKPTEVKIGHHLLHADLPNPNPENPSWNSLSPKEAWDWGLQEKKVPDEILNSSPEIQKAFYEGYYAGHGDSKDKISAAGLFYLNRNNQRVNKHKNPNIIKKIDELIKFSDGVEVYDLTTANSHFSAGVGRLVVHNTDSLYISPPEECFAQVDQAYFSKAIMRKDYWTQMCEITMEQLDRLTVDVGALLYRDNGTRFLKMAYEEVLWPYAFVGKKKYIGIQHQGIVNLTATMPECTLEEFMKSRSLFIRGLEIKKRGSSEFLKRICYQVWKEAFCITNTKTLNEIVQDALRVIVDPQKPLQMNYDLSWFIKSARYRLPGLNEHGKPKRGNVTCPTLCRTHA